MTDESRHLVDTIPYLELVAHKDDHSVELGSF